MLILIDEYLSSLIKNLSWKNDMVILKGIVL